MKKPLKKATTSRRSREERRDSDRAYEIRSVVTSQKSGHTPNEPLGDGLVFTPCFPRL
jgi:hypothetical protein